MVQKIDQWQHYDLPKGTGRHLIGPKNRPVGILQALFLKRTSGLDMSVGGDLALTDSRQGTSHTKPSILSLERPWRLDRQSTYVIRPLVDAI